MGIGRVHRGKDPWILKFDSVLLAFYQERVLYFGKMKVDHCYRPLEKIFLTPEIVGLQFRTGTPGALLIGVCLWSICI